MRKATAHQIPRPGLLGRYLARLRFGHHSLPVPAVLLCGALAVAGIGGWQSGPALAGPVGRAPAGLGGPCLSCNLKLPFITVSASHTQITVQGANFSTGTYLSVQLTNAAIPDADVEYSGYDPFYVQTGVNCFTLWCRLNSGAFSAQVTQFYDPCPGSPYPQFGATAIKAVATVANTPLGSPILTYSASTTVTC